MTDIEVAQAALFGHFIERVVQTQVGVANHFSAPSVLPTRHPFNPSSNAMLILFGSFGPHSILFKDTGKQQVWQQSHLSYSHYRTNSVTHLEKAIAYGKLFLAEVIWKLY